MGKFIKGQSGNPSGRKPGVPNKLTSDFRKRVEEFLDNNWESLQDDFNLLTPFERIQVREKFMQYVSPRLKSVEQTAELERQLNSLTDEQLQKIIDEILQKIEK